MTDSAEGTSCFSVTLNLMLTLKSASLRFTFPSLSSRSCGWAKNGAFVLGGSSCARVTGVQTEKCNPRMHCMYAPPTPSGKSRCVFHQVVCYESLTAATVRCSDDRHPTSNSYSASPLKKKESTLGFCAFLR